VQQLTGYFNIYNDILPKSPPFRPHTNRVYWKNNDNARYVVHVYILVLKEEFYQSNSFVNAISCELSSTMLLRSLRNEKILDIFHR
jgi:hypothetical protein